MRKRYLKIVHKQARIFVTRSLCLTRGGTHVSYDVRFLYLEHIWTNLVIRLTNWEPRLDGVWANCLQALRGARGERQLHTAAAC
jgi:hypothetical protein